MFDGEHIRLPLYAARIEDLGPGDFVKVDCAACHHVALLPPDALLRVGLSPTVKVLDLKGRMREEGAGGRLDKVARRGTVSGAYVGKERRRVGRITSTPSPLG